MDYQVWIEISRAELRTPSPHSVIVWEVHEMHKRKAVNHSISIYSPYI